MRLEQKLVEELGVSAAAAAAQSPKSFPARQGDLKSLVVKSTKRETYLAVHITCHCILFEVDWWGNG